MNRIVFGSQALSSLRSELLATDRERAAFVFAQPVSLANQDWRLIVGDWEVVADADYSRQEVDALEVAATSIVGPLKRAREEGLSIIFAHTHPWDGRVLPSDADLYGEARLLPRVFQRTHGVPHARLILGRRDTHAALFHPSGPPAPTTVAEVGPIVRQAPLLAKASESVSHYARQVLAFGAASQERLGEMRVAIVGLGGTGSLVAQSLAYLGVRSFLFIDPDTVEHTNLNRVVGASESDVGVHKVDVASRMVSRINSRSEVECLRGDIVSQGVSRRVLETDFFFSCTDTHGSRAVLTQLCYQFLVPGIDVGVRIDVDSDRATRIVGRVQMLAPGLACTNCTGLLDAEAVRRELLTDDERRADSYITGHGVEQPAVISINSTVVGLAVTMFLGATTEIKLQARHQIVLFDQGIVRTISSDPDPSCVVCSRGGCLGRGDSWPAPGRPS